MLDLFYRGGPLFMGLLTLIFLIIVIYSFLKGYEITEGKISNPLDISRSLGLTKELGLLALVMGVLGQLISLFAAFKSIQLGSIEVSSTVILDGFQVSMITTIYGLVIFLLAMILYRGSLYFFLKKP
jgi:hypothetical protein